MPFGTKHRAWHFPGRCVPKDFVVLGSPFDLSKEIAAIAARREPDSALKNRHALNRPETEQADATGCAKATRRGVRLPTAVNLNELV